MKSLADFLEELRILRDAVIQVNTLVRTLLGDRERAYTAGLLENVGQVVLARFLPEASSELETVIATGATRLEAEEEVLGLHHGEIGARLAERWNFPPVLVETIRHHHQPERAQLDVLQRDLGCFRVLAGRGRIELRHRW